MTLAHERTSEFFEGGKQQRRHILTPEGVPLTVELANHGERISAFLLDLLFWFLLTIAVYIPIILFGLYTQETLIALSIAMFISFLVRNFYFIYFEIAWRGATPGKRLLGLRVIDRKGGPLQPSAVIARNLTREIEAFIPIGILMTGGRGAGGAINWESFAIAVWLLFFAALPLINRDRLRGGDMIAGTMLIALPKRVLLNDLVEQPAKFKFTEPQLRAYGAFELQVLEELLRRPETSKEMQVLTEVCEKICHKIGWLTPVPPSDTVLFLREFYTAERAFLEREQLYGKARADKFSAPKPLVDPNSD
jgi:uncharacterized RDD family membrane protein YckC